jgi:hypothetical protein
MTSRFHHGQLETNADSQVDTQGASHHGHYLKAATKA